jgi:hypothetical protein
MLQLKSAVTPKGVMQSHEQLTVIVPWSVLIFSFLENPCLKHLEAHTQNACKENNSLLVYNFINVLAHRDMLSVL